MNKQCSHCKRLFTMEMEVCPYCKYENIQHELMKSNKGIKMGIIGGIIIVSLLLFVVVT